VNQGISALVEYEEVEEGIHPTATYASFARRIRTLPWGIEETRRFYKVSSLLSNYNFIQVSIIVGNSSVWYRFFDASGPLSWTNSGTVEEKILPVSILINVDDSVVMPKPREEKLHPELVRIALDAKLPLGCSISCLVLCFKVVIA
jgi:hypothetical protein